MNIIKKANFHRLSIVRLLRFVHYIIDRLPSNVLDGSKRFSSRRKPVQF